MDQPFRNLWEAAGHLESQGENFVTITVISTKGHTPQDLGAKALVTSAGLFWGTVGGGKVEARAIQEALKLLSTKNLQLKNQTVTWNLQTEIGMSCGGEMSFLFETHWSESWPIVIFGAGHVAQALIRLLLNLNCQITCVDPRREWIEKLPDHPQLTKINKDLDEKEFLQFSDKSFFMTMTQGHATDVKILKVLLKIFPHAPYLGGIGSELKAKKMKSELFEMGISSQVLERFYCPIGIKIGQNHPYEIAISIIAQLLEVRDHVQR